MSNDLIAETVGAIVEGRIRMGVTHIEIELDCGTEGWNYVTTYPNLNSRRTHIVNPDGTYHSAKNDRELEKWHEGLNDGA